MTRYDVWLDHLSLAALAPELFILDVEERMPATAEETLIPAGGDGLHIVKRTRQSLSVLVRFALRARDPARRKALMQQVRALAERTRQLSLSDRPGQFLAVDAYQFPSAHSALKWADDLTLVFTACRVPYWQQQAPALASGVRPILCPPGDAPAAPLDVTWQHQGSASAVTLTIITPMSSITFQDMPIAAGEALVLEHPGGLLAAHIGARDALPFRTPHSSDDLFIPCGMHSTVHITTAQDVPQRFTLSARGRWL